MPSELALTEDEIRPLQLWRAKGIAEALEFEQACHGSLSPIVGITDLDGPDTCYFTAVRVEKSTNVTMHGRLLLTNRRAHLCCEPGPGTDGRPLE